MSLFMFLSVLQALVAAALVGVVLMQRSEGGGLGIGGGGSPGGLMSARGAADFLTRTTKWLAITFVALAIVLAGLAVNTTGSRSLDDSLERTPAAPVDPLAPAVDPLAPAASGDAAATANTAEPAGADPLSPAAQ